MIAQIAAAVLVGYILFLILHRIYTSLTSPLRSIPGPLPARLTKLWFARRVHAGRFEHDNVALHARHGPVVRVAPTWYSIDDPAAVKSIYGIGTHFTKGEWYEGWKHPDPERWTLFPDRDTRRHAETRRRFQGMFSMSSLVSYEGYVDRCADVLELRLEELARAGSTVDLGHWLQCYAFDVIASITFGERFGFLEAGVDLDGTMRALEHTMWYSSLVGIYAWLHPLIFNLAAHVPWSGARGRLYIMQFAQKHITAQKLRMKPESSTTTTAAGQDTGSMPQTFLEKLLRAHEQDPVKVTQYHIFIMAQSNIIAGSDTTAISLCAILYHLLRAPHVLSKLKREFASAGFGDAHNCTTPITFATANSLPYFSAVIKEALRLHPATGLPLWRDVPASGAELCGYVFPPGTTVGVNTWVAHRNVSVFGCDADVFRPERWIEAEAADESGTDIERLRQMNAYYMPFGLGSRTCLGRNISMLEMVTLVPRLLRRFDFEMMRNGEWETENGWFVKPRGFDVRVRMVGGG